ncbi:MAG: hypothetical protein GC190_10375 [Alphaproteobacteria bacterium]|nr:hypothetical protein [Alphaproteobacteria bacterium]
MRVALIISAFLVGTIVAPLVWNVQTSRAADDTLITSFSDDNVTAAIQAAGATDVSISKTSSGSKFAAYVYAGRKYRAYFHDCTGDECLGLQLSALFSGAKVPLEAINEYNQRRAGGKATRYSETSFGSNRFVTAIHGVSASNLAFEVANHFTLTDLLLDQLRGDQLISMRAAPPPAAFSDHNGMMTVQGRPRPLVGVTPSIPPGLDPASVNILR